MFLNYLKWNKILKKLVNSNEIHRSHFSVLAKCCNVDSILFNQMSANPDFIQPHNRRDFIGFVPDRKDGYGKQKDVSNKEHIKFGLKQLKTELKLWSAEMTEAIRGDPILILPPGLWPVLTVLHAYFLGQFGLLFLICFTLILIVFR